MTDLSPEELEKARDATQRVGKYAAITLAALQADAGVPLMALGDGGYAEMLRNACNDLLAADDSIVVRYEPTEQDVRVVGVLARGPQPYVPDSLAELDSDEFTLDDRKSLAGLLAGWLHSDVFPEDPLDVRSRLDPSSLVSHCNALLEVLTGWSPDGGTE